MFTLTNWIIFGILLIIGIAISLIMGIETEDVLAGVTSGAILVILIAVIMGITGWYNTSTAAGKRAVKDYKSNVNNGIEREIVITAEDGREIFRYEGKIDIESNHTDNYIKFDDEHGKRYIIYYGVQDTILIIEK